MIILRQSLHKTVPILKLWIMKPILIFFQQISFEKTQNCVSATCSILTRPPLLFSKLKTHLTSKISGNEGQSKKYNRTILIHIKRVISKVVWPIENSLECKWTIFKKINVSLIVHSFIGKYSFSLDTFWTHELVHTSLKKLNSLQIECSVDLSNISTFVFS